MNVLRWTLLLLVLSGLLDSRAAEGQLPSVVQLPSFQTFSYSGSVLVPDRGTAVLGGNRTSASFSSRSPFHRRVFGGQTNQQAAISATIIDLQEMDRQILGGSPQQFAKRSSDGSQPGGPLGRLADPILEGKSLVRRARQLYLEDRKSDAFATYQVAIEVLPGRLRELAIAEFRRVFGAAADQSLERTGIASAH